ncbi:hypothetical protein MKZ38_006904 [Zalerion maritima]|uniref:Uncharacterized protein n=1 Tax=Zalerion maritima TaxID=339359 RepID=A0AAD5RIN0_9PEZI|nr:hypothetical protein MKZ38_006904 [Zalerion maritima]
MATEPTLIEKLLDLGTRAHNPSVDDPQILQEHQEAFTTFIAKTPTLALIPALNALIHRDRVPPWLHSELVTVLARIPYSRPQNDGVRATMEFVFSVHPDSTVTREEAATVQKQGAFITPEAMKLASNLIASPAAGVPADEWFEGIAPQLLRLLDGDEGPELVKVAGNVIGRGILGRKEFGGLGTPGFNTFVHPMLSKLNPSLPTPYTDNKKLKVGEDEEEVVDLRDEITLVSSDDLASALKRLHALIHAHGHPALARRLLRPVLLSLWALSSWVGATDECQKRYCNPARDLFKIFIRLHASHDDTRGIIKTLMFKGNKNPGKLTWTFDTTSDGLIYILKIREGNASNQNFAAIDELEPKANSFVTSLDEVSSADEISTLFLDLFKQWYASNKKKAVNEIIVKQEESDPVVALLEAKVLQALMEKAPQKLIGHPDQILDLVKEVLQDNESHLDDEGPMGIGISLLGQLVHATGFEKSKIDRSVMDSIVESLERISRENSNLATTARNLSLLLQNWSEIEAELQPMPTASKREIEDRKTYNVAMQYITGPEAPAPVRSEGLNMISKLIVAQSPILDIPAVLVLLSSMLEDGDDFVNLRIIKIFTQLANHHPSSTVQELLDNYVDAQEKRNVDTRLRFGEALVRVVERLGETFTGDVSAKTCEFLLTMAGRRPKRERTRKRQEKDARLAEMKRKKEAKAWGGELPNWDEDEDKDLPPEEKERNGILASIVGGWESKRGSEDVRIRASALSILGAGIETNIAGVGTELVTAAVDLSMDVLTLEPEIERGILRRSAVLAVMSFVRALDSAKDGQKWLGFDLTEQSREKLSRVLSYIADTDNDGLVQQHAKDVVESLANWKMATLMPMTPRQANEPAFTRLAGLAVDPTHGLTSLSGNNGRRPVIEEIE